MAMICVSLNCVTNINIYIYIYIYIYTYIYVYVICISMIITRQFRLVYCWSKALRFVNNIALPCSRILS